MTDTGNGLRLTLREYQEEAIARTVAAEERGARRQLGVAATGLGKTIIFCALASRRPGRTLILAHRDELVSQAVAKVQEVWPGVEVGVVKAERDETHAHVVVASVQTLARGKRLARLTADSLLRPSAPFGLVVVDEAHHTAADTYRRILDHLDAGEPDGPLLLGVTATPDRGDGQGLDDLFDEIAWNYDILWGIRSGFLCDVRGLRIELADLDLTDVKVRRGDYDAGSAGRALEEAQAPLKVVRSWLDHASNRQTLVFTPTVELARLVAEEFQRARVAAAMVCGATPLDERRDILARYARGDLQVVANCAVLTEGYDEPRTDCIVVARPTKSRALYTQMVGRGTRRHPDKTDLLVLDVVGASEAHSLVTVPSLFGLGEEEARAMGDGTAVLTDAVDEHERKLVAIGRLTAEEADLFHRMRSDGIAWVSVHAAGSPRRMYQRSLGSEFPTVVLGQQREDEDVWNVGLLMPKENGKRERRYLMRDVPLEMAQGVGEDWIRKHARGGLRLADAGAPWRERPATAKQRKFAKRLGVEVPKDTTAGEASDLIDAALARQ